MQATEQRAAKQPEATTSVSNVALQALQTDLQHQVCTQLVQSMRATHCEPYSTL